MLAMMTLKGEGTEKSVVKGIEYLLEARNEISSDYEIEAYIDTLDEILNELF